MHHTYMHHIYMHHIYMHHTGACGLDHHLHLPRHWLPGTYIRTCIHTCIPSSAPSSALASWYVHTYMHTYMHTIVCTFLGIGFLVRTYVHAYIHAFYMHAYVQVGPVLAGALHGAHSRYREPMLMASALLVAAAALTRLSVWRFRTPTLAKAPHAPTLCKQDKTTSRGGLRSMRKAGEVPKP